MNIFGAPYELSDHMIADHLRTFGLIIGKHWGHFVTHPEVENGIRHWQMLLDHPILGVVQVGPVKLSVKYEGQPGSCYKCGSFGHPPTNCPNNICHFCGGMGHRVAEWQSGRQSRAPVPSVEPGSTSHTSAPLPTRTSIISPLGETTSLTARIPTPQRRNPHLNPPVLAPVLPWEPRPSHHLLPLPTLPTPLNLPYPPQPPLPTLPHPHPFHPNLPPFHTPPSISYPPVFPTLCYS